jgi:hypothetical protein
VLGFVIVDLVRIGVGKADLMRVGRGQGGGLLGICAISYWLLRTAKQLAIESRWRLPIQNSLGE